MKTERGKNRKVPVFQSRKKPSKHAENPHLRNKSIESIDPSVEIRLILTAPPSSIKRTVSLRKFEQALDCAGSFILHFAVDKTSEQGLEGQRLLMSLLEPLLGENVEYRVLIGALNAYLQSKRYMSEASGQSENVKRFIKVVTSGWKGKPR